MQASRIVAAVALAQRGMQPVHSGIHTRHNYPSAVKTQRRPNHIGADWGDVPAGGSRRGVRMGGCRQIGESVIMQAYDCVTTHQAHFGPGSNLQDGLTVRLRRDPIEHPEAAHLLRLAARHLLVKKREYPGLGRPHLALQLSGDQTATLRSLHARRHLGRPDRRPQLDDDGDAAVATSPELFEQRWLDLANDRSLQRRHPGACVIRQRHLR